jgi:ribosome-binding protein aMBF1 (putative translation factor)
VKTLKTLKRELLPDTRTARAYAGLAEEFDVARTLIDARVRAGLSQIEVAERMGTTQSVIARLESGRRPPSMRTVERFARAVGGRLIVRIEPTRAAG